MNKFFVSRQKYYWEEQPCAVEVAVGTVDDMGPDALVAKYPGELEEYADPREAVSAALAIRAAWIQDGQPEVSLCVLPSGHGGLIATGTEHSPEELLEWGNAKYEALPKCDHCGGIGAEEYTSVNTGETYMACSDQHAQEIIEKEEEAGDGEES